MKLQAAIHGFLMDRELRNHSPNTLRTYRSQLRVVARWLEEQGVTDVEDVTITNLRAFLVHTQQRPASSINPRRPSDASGQTLTVATMQGYVKAIKVLFGWLVDEEVLARNPAARLQKPSGEKRLRVSFSDEHLSALFGVCDLETSLGFRDYTLMLMLLDTGIRVEELCKITLDDVREGYVTIWGKGRKEREVGITPTTAKFLWKYINLHRAAESDAVKTLFTNIRGRPMTPSGVEQVFDKVAEAAGLADDVVVTPHKLRHTFARTWLERGGDVYSLSRLLGHSSVKITEIYLEDFKSRQARVQYAQFSPLGKLRVRQRGHGRHTYHRGPRNGGLKPRQQGVEGPESSGENEA
jgi:site-specific recombinase XerD